MENNEQQPHPAQPESHEAAGVLPLDSLPDALGCVESDHMKLFKVMITQVVTGEPVPLPEGIGFVEVGGVKQLNHFSAEGISDEAYARLLLGVYRTLGERQVEAVQGEEYPRAQVGLLIRLALIKRDMGRMADYAEDLEDALEYASNMGYEEVVVSIEAALDRLEEALESAERAQYSNAIADVLRGLGAESGFDEQTCLGIASLPPEEAFMTAYGSLIKAGEDPDEVLAPFMDETKGE